jgi:hypothetical protein
MASTPAQTIFDTYMETLARTEQQGDAREESFYPALAAMLHDAAGELCQTRVHVTVQPSPTDAGNPDFRVWNGVDRVVGYIEAKRPGADLDAAENSPQLARYLSTFPNLILTNFLEFRLYRDGARQETVPAARPLILQTLGAAPPVEKPEELAALLERFFAFALPPARTAEELARELARRARFLREVAQLQLEREKEAPDTLTEFYEAFRSYLINTLTIETFADLFAQTISHGLFAARTRAGDGFNRRAAFDHIPPTIGVLRDVFRYISLADLTPELAWCVEDLAHVLAVSDAPGILARDYREGGTEDPIVHFYETFLAQYDPEERERRGVYYTPEQVVSYITRSLHGALKTSFGKADGLASGDVTLLDPAAGTMTFVAGAVRLAVREFEEKYGGGARGEFIRNHVLKNFFAFELMMAPYAMGHIKMGFLLEELGCRLSDKERMPFYLTNTLDFEELEQSRLPGLSSLAGESRLAGDIKRKTSILVILGNPPYSGHSSNTGDWIRGLIEDYKKVDGKPLGEKNPKWLQDDYVKFLRFAQYKIEQAGQGAVGMITNHGYLDNPTFRGMRQSLLRTFDAIFILDLHGNALKKETCPDGSADQNVFDIRQGVAIALFVRRGGRRNGPARAHHFDLWGSRESKQAWLEGHEVSTTNWETLTPAPPFYLFTPRDNALEAMYYSFPSVPALFPVNSVGVVTARDKLAIHWTPEEVWKTVTVFSKMDPERAREGYGLGKDTRDWKVALAQEDIGKSGPARKHIVPILYRPFDIRYTYYTGRSRGFLCRPRRNVMRQMLPGGNIALITSRLTKGEKFHHAQVTDKISEVICMSPNTSNNGFVFPLYVYSSSKGDVLFAGNGVKTEERAPNLTPGLLAALSDAYGTTVPPEDVFHYVAAVLHAPDYRARYAEFLRTDFPRVPFPSDRELFTAMAALGARVAALHLLESPELSPPLCRFHGEGGRRVDPGKKTGLRYEPETETVWINPGQRFAPVPPDVWQYQIGGYQVCEKWLKERQEKVLDLPEIMAYCRIVTAISRMMMVQEEINAVYPLVENGTLNLSLIG